jgi:hypothetical protein
LVHHNRINIIHRAKVLARPLEVLELLVRGVAGVEAGALPFPDQLLGVCRAELVVNFCDGGFGDGAVYLGQLEEFVLRAAPFSVLADCQL